MSLLLLLRASSGGPTLVAVGQPAETDAAQPVAKVKARAVGQPAESDAAQPVARVKARTVAQATETDLAQPATRRKARTLGQPAGTDLAQPVAKVKARAVGQAGETDTAQPIGRGGVKNILVGQATDTGTAQPIAKAKRRTLGQPADTATAQPATRVKTRAVLTVLESDTAVAFTRRKARALGQPATTDTGQPAARRKTWTLGQPSESDTAQPVTVTGGAPIVPVLTSPWAGVLATGRRLAGTLMVDACTITRATGVRTQSETTGRVTTTATAVYSGACQVRMPPAVPDDAPSGERTATLQPLIVKVPVTVTGIRVGDLVTVTGAAHDPDLIGRTFTVAGVHHKTYSTARKLAVTETTA